MECIRATFVKKCNLLLLYHLNKARVIGIKIKDCKKKDAKNICKELFPDKLKIIQWKIYDEFPLLKVYIDVTYRCNLKCTHCLASTYIEDLDHSIIRRLCRELHSMNVFEVAIGGGEPTLYSYFEKLINHLVSNKILFYITTNCMNPEPLLSLFLKQKNRTFLGKIKISVDGNKNTHESIRGKGTYQLMIKNLRRMLSLNLPVSLRCTLFPFTNVDDIRSVLTLARTLKVKSVKFATVKPAGSALGNFSFNKESFKKVMSSVQKIIPFFSKNVRISFSNDMPFFQFLLDYRKYYSKVYNQFGCSAGKTSLHIDPSGNVRGCIFIPSLTPAGNLHDKSLKYIWSSAAFLFLRNLKGNRKCLQCKYYGKACWGGCRGRAVLAFKDINACDPLCSIN